MTKQEQVFVKTVWDYYYRHGRHQLPWRKNQTPYRVLVSEVMLQQTQAERVVPKFRTFIKQFPTARALARASVGDVLRAWQGLGYNRRGKMLHAAASMVVAEYSGRFPKEREALVALPGVGPYTAGAIMAFAHNQATPFIETNIRSVYLHHFFRKHREITDRQILEKVARTVSEENPREWYAALMDYGAHLKKQYGNPNTQSRHYTKQSKFIGSNRQIRGAILRRLVEGGVTKSVLIHELAFDSARLSAQLDALMTEGMIVFRHGQYRFPE